MEANKKIAIAGSKLLYLDGSIQEAGGKLFKDGSAQNLGRGEKRYASEFNIKKNVDYISGASILVNKQFWNDCGGFDERYKPAYCEDSDLAMAAHSKNLYVTFIPRSEVVHFEHASYGEQLQFSPKERQKENTEKLYQKWQVEFQNFDDPI